MLGAAAEFWRNFRGLNEPREKPNFGSSATSGAISGGDGDSGEPNAKRPKNDGLRFKLKFGPTQNEVYSLRQSGHF